MRIGTSGLGGTHPMTLPGMPVSTHPSCCPGQPSRVRRAVANLAPLIHSSSSRDPYPWSLQLAAFPLSLLPFRPLAQTGHTQPLGGSVSTALYHHIRSSEKAGPKSQALVNGTWTWLRARSGVSMKWFYPDKLTAMGAAHPCRGWHR